MANQNENVLEFPLGFRQILVPVGGKGTLVATSQIDLRDDASRLILTQSSHWTWRGKEPDDLYITQIRVNGVNQIREHVGGIATTVFAPSSVGVRLKLDPIPAGTRVEVDIESFERHAWWRFWRRSSKHTIGACLLALANNDRSSSRRCVSL